MEISDIIKTDTDRIFTVDPECYIIFTGESTDDIQPFIRIGTWTDMPIELIPLIENIIITDGLVGDPSHEQFNIDVRYLSTNRYIGSRTVVKKFLDFQKIFSLDLTNATVVDIEKDLPELSAEKNISHKNQFIGVFYRDGNFKILLGRNTLFDLNRVLREPINYKKLNDTLSDRSGGTRYGGSGLVITGHNPVFYHGNAFSSYLFPGGYFGDFSRLGIDPAKIRAVFHPSQNLMNLTKLLKWLDGLQKKIRIYTNRDDIGLMKKLFTGCAIKNEAFTGLEYREGGLTVRNYPGTYNLSLRYDGAGPGGGPLSVAFIKGPAGAPEIIREGHDCLVMTYSAFEDINLLLKSTDTPWVIIDDGNRNILKIGGDRIILTSGVHYEFRVFESFEDLLSVPRISDPALSASRSDPAALAQETRAWLEKSGDNFSRQADILNLVTLVRIHLAYQRDRRISSLLLSTAKDLAAAADRSWLTAHSQGVTVLLSLNGKSLFPVIVERAEPGGPLLFDEVIPRNEAAAAGMGTATADYFNRILADRERLKLLIDIYTRSEKYPAAGKELDRLREAIGERREKYRGESLSLDRNGTPDGVAMESAEQRQPHRDGTKRRLRRIALFSVPLILILAVLIIILVNYSSRISAVFTAAQERVTQSRDIDRRYRDLGKKHNIRIKVNDILRYANRVAINNGYRPIASTKLRERNPDWIYPENAFIMLDGQKVVVSRGDTLWNLSRNKLIESTLAFNKIMQDFPAAGKQRKLLLIEQARRHAYTRDQLELLTKTMNELQKTVGDSPQ